VRRFVKRFVCFIFYWTGITPLLLRFWRKDRLLFLLYHRVREPEHAFEAAVSCATFERQMQFLKKHFDVVSVREALRRKQKREISAKPLAAITFDDGYRDNYSAAYPILKKYSLPATFFLTAGSIGNGEPMWTSRLEAIFKNAEVKELTLETLSPARSFALGDSRERMKVCHEVKAEMKRVPDSVRQEILEELLEKTGLDPKASPSESEMLSWEEAALLAEDPLVEIGSHSVSHRMLSRLPAEEVRWELEESRKKIEAELGRPVLFLSYPGNSYNGTVRDLARMTGYKAAFAVGRTLSSLEEDLHELKRVHVEEEPFPVFLAEITGVLPFFRNLFRTPEKKK